MARAKERTKARAKSATKPATATRAEAKSAAKPATAKPATGGDKASALLAQIADALDDDAPRLVYADLVAEQGDDARAELIRLQLERANAGGVMPSRREVSLATQNGARWLAPIVPAIQKRSWGFERGFLDYVALRPRKAAHDVAGDPLWSTVRRVWVEAGDATPILAHPMMRNLRSVGYGKHTDGLASLLALAALIERISGLDMDCIRADGLTRPLFDCTGLPSLTSIEIAGAVSREGPQLWSSGLDRPGLTIVLPTYASRLAGWWSKLVASPPCHARVLVVTADLQSRLDGKTIELTAGRNPVELMRILGLMLGLAGRIEVEQLDATVASIRVRLPPDWRARPSVLSDFATLDEIASRATEAARAIGTTIEIVEGDFTCEALADPREY